MSIVNIVKEPEYYYPAGMAEQDGLMTYQESQKLDNIPTPSSIVTKSSTAGLLKNDGTVDSNSYVKKSDLEEIKTATGNPITLTDAIAGNAIEVSAEIVASQDLHGYDKPWVGGAGINKLPLVLADIKSANTSGTWSDNVYTLNGGTFTVNTDSDGNVTGITANGTFSANSDFNIAPKGNYNALNGLILYAGVTCSTSTYTIYCAMRVSPWTAYAYLQNVSSVTISNVPNDSNTGFFIRVFAGSVSNVAFKPMVATAGITGFYPYTNICPITGYSSVTITDVDAESHTATVTVSLGSTVYGGTLNVTTGVLTVDRIKIIPDSTTEWVQGSASNNYRWRMYLTDASSNYDVDTDKKISSVLEYKTSVYSDSTTDIGFIINGGSLFARFGAEYDTLAKVQALCGSTTVEFCYPLATPTTTTLTAAQLALVKGYNRLSSDGGGDIALEYLPDNALNELYKKVNDETDTKIGSLDASDVDALPDSVIIATEFSEETTYVKNKYVIYNGVIYRCTEYHAAGAWNASHFTPVSVCDELFDAGSFNKFYGNADYDGTTEYKVDHSYVHQGSSNIPDYPSDGKAGTTNRFGILKTMRIETGYIFQTLIVSYEGEPSGDDPTIKSKFYYRSAIRIDGTYVWGNWYETTGTEIV